MHSRCSRPSVARFLCGTSPMCVELPVAFDFEMISSPQRAKHSAVEARDIALRTQAILDIIADAVPDSSAIPAHMRVNIERFILTLDDVHDRMRSLALTSHLSRLVHLNRNERVLRDIKTKLDDAYRDRLAASTLRLEVQQEKTRAEISSLKATVPPEMARILFYSRSSVFLASP
ncbi:hypothetical protein C8R43DRAFT_500378 [Mycena crocata]|nr:hypothetical protein C8R43DRAFT_500378 [Mycena crocata]